MSHNGSNHGDYDCNKWCSINCMVIDVGKQERADCITAMANCECHHFYQNPLFWIFGSLALIMGSVALRALFVSVCNRRQRAAAGTMANPVVIATRKDSDSVEYLTNLAPHQQITFATSTADRLQRKITIVLTPSYTDSE